MATVLASGPPPGETRTSRNRVIVYSFLYCLQCVYCRSASAGQVFGNGSQGSREQAYDDSDREIVNPALRIVVKNASADDREENGGDGRQNPRRVTILLIAPLIGLVQKRCHD